MPCDEAIRRGEAVRDQAVAKYRLSLLRRTPALLLYDLAGRETVGSRGAVAMKETPHGARHPRERDRIGAARTSIPVLIVRPERAR
jgi:hypothetical protein